MARKEKKKKGNSVRVDFTDVQSNALLPEADYRFRVKSAEHKENDGDGSIAVRLEVVEADNKKLVGKTTLVYFNLGASSLWVLRAFLDAVGVDVPEDEFDIDMDAIVDAEFTATNTHNTYNDKTKNQLSNFIAADGSTSDDEDEDEVEIEDEDEPKSKKAKKSKKSKDEDDEDEDEAPKSKKAKKSSKKVEDDEDEEEDEPKAKKGKAKKASKKDEDEEDEDSDKVAEAEVDEMTEKELKSLIKKHKLDVDPDDYPNARKLRLAVKDALEEEGLLETDE